MLAAIAGSLGTFTERWLFFAEALVHAVPLRAASAGGAVRVAAAPSASRSPASGAAARGSSAAPAMLMRGFEINAPAVIWRPPPQSCAQQRGDRAIA